MNEKMLSNEINNAANKESPLVPEDKKSLLEKIKGVLNIVRPQELEDAMYKIVGLWTAYSGVELGKKVLEHQEKINISGVELGHSADVAAGILALLLVAAGAGSVFIGIREAIESIEIKKQLEEEKK